MDDLLKKIVQAIEDGDADVKVIKVGNPKPEPDKMSEAKKEAMEIAEMNKVLYDAHIAVGFTSEEAIKLVAANNM